MSYVPGCRADVFISYAKLDNQDNWVTKVEARLAEKLAAHLGRKQIVWFDSEIRPGENFEEDIQERLRRTPVFVAFVSPSYLQSPFCMEKELEWFQSQGGKHVIQLVKVPLERGHQDVPLPQSSYVKLYDEADERQLAGKRLDDALHAVALKIRDLLRESWNARTKVYLAQIRDEAHRAAWDGLRERLHEAGYAILPAEVLIGGLPEQRIRGWLEECSISLHLDGLQNDSMASRQLEIARRVARPVRILEGAPRSDEAAEVIAAIQAELQAQTRALYFIYDDHSDGPRVSELSRQIGLRTGMKVLTPGSSEKSHKERLRTSDGILLFRCEAPDEWRDAQEQALRQCLALRREAAVPVARYSARPVDGSQASVRVEQQPAREWTIERTGDVNVSDLEPFFAALPR